MKRVVLVLASGVLLGSSAPPRAEISVPGDVRVASYNVNYGLAGDPETLQALAATNADVIFVQEANAAWADAFLQLRARWPHQALVDHGAAGGMAILSRYPFDEGEVIPSAVGWFPAWKVVVDTPQGQLQALQLHLHPPFDDRWGWAAGPFTTSDDRELELVVALDSLDEGLPTVVLGDFNERRGRAIRLMQDRGFEDALPRFAPGARTWSWDLPVGRLTGTFDHVFTGNGARAVGGAVRDEGRSDHRPVVVDVVL